MPTHESKYTFEELCKSFSKDTEFTLTVPNLSFHIEVTKEEILVNTSEGADIIMSHFEFIRFMTFFDNISNGVKISHE